MDKSITESIDGQDIKKKRVSFSQYSKWLKCPHHFYLDYIIGPRKSDGNLNTVFGTAMHHAIQTYITKLYVEGKDSVKTLDVHALFKVKLEEEKNKELEKNKFEYTPEEYKEFIDDGETILDCLLHPTIIKKYFPHDKYEFIGVEVPIDTEIKNNIQFVAFIDLILKDKTTGKYRIFDLKTARSAWTNHKKEDEGVYSQVLLYKAFYSKKLNVSLNDIDVEFFILKRKLYENVAFPQTHIQIFEPPHNKSAVMEAIDGFVSFIDECFTVDGQHNKDIKYIKIPGKQNKNCKYCSHYKIKCDAKADKLPD